MTGERQNDWDECIDPILFAIRTSVQESTKHSPFFLMYGREAKLPLEVEKGKIDSKSNELGEVEQAINHLQSIMDEVFPVVVSNIDASQKKQKDQYTRRKGLIQTSNIKEGDLVLRLNMLKLTKKGHKEEDTWKGPYKVVSITKYGCCNLECPTTGRVIKQKVNIRQLKQYQEQLTDSVQPLRSFSSEEVCEGFVQIPEEIIEENKGTDDSTSSDDMLEVNYIIVLHSYHII